MSAPGGSGSYDPGMEGRFTSMEADIREMKGVALPTTLQLLGFVVALFVAAGLTNHFFH